MTVTLSDSIFLRSYGDCYLGLDLRRDKYTFYQGGIAESITRYLSGCASHSDIILLDQCAIAPHVLQVIPALDAAAPVPVRELGASGTVIPILLSAWILWNERRVRHALARSGLPAVLEQLSIRKASCQSIVSGQYSLIAGACRYLDFLRPQANRCLVNSIAVMDILLRRGCAADLYFGVTLPFAAHCWVQQGGHVLNDRTDRVAAFDPIMVI